MKMRDRMNRASPLMKALISRLDLLIAGHNNLVAIVIGGQAPHKVNDVTNVLTLGAANVLDEIIDLEQQIITKYEAHLGSSTHHIGADSANLVTELGVPEEIYALLNELKVDYEAHRVYVGGSCHAGTDTSNTISAADADTKAKAVTLANDLKTQFVANYANVSTHHGAADTANPPTFTDLDGDSTWTEIAAAADEMRASHEAHRILTAGSVHGGTDATTAVTATAVGTVQTAVNTGLNEIKGDFNTHIQESGSYHYIPDTSMEITETNASSLATSRTLVNALRIDFTDHISRAAESAATGPTVPTLDVE